MNQAYFLCGRLKGRNECSVRFTEKERIAAVIQGTLQSALMLFFVLKTFLYFINLRSR